MQYLRKGETQMQLNNSQEKKKFDRNARANEVDLVQVAKEYSYWSNIPRSLSDKRANEISLLCKHYLEIHAKVTRLGLK